MRPILISLLFFISSWQTEDKILFKTLSGDSILVSKDIIHYNNKPISKSIEGIVYSSKYNRIIEQNSTILLFLELEGSPNFNTLKAFKLTSQKATELVECVYNDKSQGGGPAPFTDMDGDGKLEFGGFDITEGYENKDSMYYIPSEYYEINNGTIRFDSSLTKKMDIKVNGIYLSKPLDQNGNCCVVIKKPTNKKSH